MWGHVNKSELLWVGAFPKSNRLIFREEMLKIHATFVSSQPIIRVDAGTNEKHDDRN
jgi:hypothetical protein